MKFHILTLFPEMILQGLHLSMIGKAVDKNIISINAVDIRDYSLEKHRKVDDYPYGGGAGMLMQAQPVYDAHKAVTGGRSVRTIYVTPQGMPFTQAKAEEFAAEEELVLLCGHYEGIDERVLEEVVTDYISIGDYVLTGGELPAMVMVDAIARLIPGVLGNDSSAEEESFHNDLLEYPQYSRPETWRGVKVPEVLLSGNHSKVAAWRLEQSMCRTRDRRPDLYAKYQKRQLLITYLAREKRNNIHMMESLTRGYGEILYLDYGLENNEKDAAKLGNFGDVDILLYDSRNRICMISARNVVSGEKMAQILPRNTEYVFSLQEFMGGILTGASKEAYEGKKPFQMYGSYTSMLYTQKISLPVKHKNIRPLTVADQPLLEGFGTEFYNAVDYLQNRLKTGLMYGIFTENTLAGTIGLHKGGSIGLLYVDKPYRRQGFAASLMAYMVNRMLERGWIPYCHIPLEDSVSEALLEKARFYKAARKVSIYQRTNEPDR